MSVVPVNPRPFLLSLIGKVVFVRLKWGEMEFKGRLVSTDSYMNIQLSGADEYISRKKTGTLGQIFIRCNNVLWIREATEKDEEDEDADPDEKADVAMDDG